MCESMYVKFDLLMPIFLKKTNSFCLNEIFSNRKQNKIKKNIFSSALLKYAKGHQYQQ